jgi:hypothetical protein
MAQQPEVVAAFLASLRDRLQPHLKEEIGTMLEMQQQLPSSMHTPTLLPADRHFFTGLAQVRCPSLSISQHPSGSSLGWRRYGALPSLSANTPQLLRWAGAGTVPVFRQKSTLPRMPLSFTPLLRLKRAGVLPMALLSSVHFIAGWHCKFRPNTEGLGPLTTVRTLTLISVTHC